MNTTTPSAQALLAGGALLLLGVIGVTMLFVPIPTANGQSVTFILGALAGALTLSGAGKVADKITNSNAPGAVIQPDAEQGHHA